MAVISPQGRRNIMRAVKSKNTSLEIRLRKAIFATGYRYRLHCKELPGTPDIVFPGRKKIIFVHGCFWHQHTNCERAKKPITNTNYWLPKLKMNALRDEKNLCLLTELGWQVHIVWECSFSNFQTVVNETIDFLENVKNKK